jgi:hypothetical protein
VPTIPDAASDAPGHAVQLFDAEDIYVSNGANLGDGLGGPEEVCLGDVYDLAEGAKPLRLVLTAPQGHAQAVAPGSEIGQPGQAVVLEARYGLMAPDGDKVDLLIISLAGAGRFALPLSPIGAHVDYTLLTVEPAPQDLFLADVMCLSFARGTAITLADGSQRAIEALTPGMRILTRDHGPQPIRWIGQARLRAVGAFAPVVIAAGTLGNAGDLVVSQHHRMFLYQRKRLPGLTTSELLVQARHFIDGSHAWLREGGFVDYFSLVFDHHEIIYAEGIPAESLMVNDATLNRLPEGLAERMRAEFPGLSQNPHFGTEAGRQFLDALGSAAPFRGKGGR